MPLTSAYVEREARARLLRFDQRLGDEIRRLRTEAGVRISELARFVRVDASHLSRIERGLSRPSVELVMRIGVALGADPSLRYFPTDGPRLKDRFQAPIVEALLRAAHDRWSRRVEVGVTDPARGVIDAVLEDHVAEVTVAVESCSRIDRLELLLRWHGEKADGLGRTMGQPVSRLLLLRSTSHNRDVVTRYAATVEAAFPAKTRDVVAALTGEAPWPGAGVVWMRLEAGTATLLPTPPRGVTVGRCLSVRFRSS